MGGPKYISSPPHSYGQQCQNHSPHGYQHPHGHHYHHSNSSSSNHPNGEHPKSTPPSTTAAAAATRPEGKQGYDHPHSRPRDVIVETYDPLAGTRAARGSIPRTGVDTLLDAAGVLPPISVEPPEITRDVLLRSANTDHYSERLPFWSPPSVLQESPHPAFHTSASNYHHHVRANTIRSVGASMGPTTAITTSPTTPTHIHCSSSRGEGDPLRVLSSAATDSNADTSKRGWGGSQPTASTSSSSSSLSSSMFPSLEAYATHKPASKAGTATPSRLSPIAPRTTANNTILYGERRNSNHYSETSVRNNNNTGGVTGRSRISIDALLDTNSNYDDCGESIGSSCGMGMSSPRKRNHSADDQMDPLPLRFSKHARTESSVAAITSNSNQKKPWSTLSTNSNNNGLSRGSNNIGGQIQFEALESFRIHRYADTNGKDGGGSAESGSSSSRAQSNGYYSVQNRKKVTPVAGATGGARDAKKKNSGNFVTITCYHASVAQKSYGGEKRFLCPPPAVVMNGSGYSADVAHKSPLNLSVIHEEPSAATTSRGKQTSNINSSNDGAKDNNQIVSRNSSRMHAPLGSPEIFNDRNVAMFKSLHVTGAPRSKSFYLQLELAAPDDVSALHLGLDAAKADGDRQQSLSSSSCGLKTYASCRSEPVAIISKPSKKTSKARNQSSCIQSGALIAMFSRINSQTYRTKYMVADNDTLELMAQGKNWSTFRIDVIRRPNGALVDSTSNSATNGSNDGSINSGSDTKGTAGSKQDKTDTTTTTPLLYGSVVTLTDIINGYRSPPMVIRKVEKGRLVSDNNSPVSQMQKVALQLIHQQQNGEIIPEASSYFLNSGSNTSYDDSDYESSICYDSHGNSMKLSDLKASPSSPSSANYKDKDIDLSSSPELLPKGSSTSNNVGQQLSTSSQPSQSSSSSRLTFQKMPFAGTKKPMLPINGSNGSGGNYINGSGPPTFNGVSIDDYFCWTIVGISSFTYNFSITEPSSPSSSYYKKR
ncbi:hypothetical protein H4219_003179 [Mycoemilia scoparia]|uniref:P53-like transcription factor n=1 Tax=Mycoemilia scoparia TaxID=417184 RepID=A0A9W7ZVL7_9FUNG|nr:hypothetical protein H4219_003179 [Mycoemilia scoparia]